MIWSVSTLAWSIGTATAVSLMNGSTGKLLAQHLAHVGEAAGHGGRRGHRWAHEMRAHATPLAADEVAVRGRSDALSRDADVAIDADAHGASGLAPFEAGLAEDLVQAFRLGLLLDQARARDNPGRHLGLSALGDLGGHAQVLDATVGAGTDEDTIHRDLLDRRAGLQIHVVERPPHAFLLGLIG